MVGPIFWKFNPTILSFFAVGSNYTNLDFLGFLNQLSKVLATYFFVLYRISYFIHEREGCPVSCPISFVVSRYFEVSLCYLRGTECGGMICGFIKREAITKVKRDKQQVYKNRWINNRLHKFFLWMTRHKHLTKQ